MLGCIVSGWFSQPTIPLTNGCAALPQKREESGSVYVCDQHAGRVWAKLASHHSVDCAFISSRHTLMSTGSLMSPPKSGPYIITLVSGLCFHSVLSLSLWHQQLSSMYLKKKETCHYWPALRQH